MFKKLMRFFRCFLILLLIFLLTPTLFAASKNSLSSSFSEANKQTQEGDYEGAAASYQAILEKNPDNQQALLGLGQVLYWQGDYERAINEYGKILSNNPKEVDALTGTGKAYLAMGKQKKAQDFFNRAKKIEPTNEEASAVSPQIGEKSSIEVLGGYIIGNFNYAAEMQGEYQKLTISKERTFAFGLTSTYLNKFTQNAFNTELFGQYYLFENTRVDANLSFAPQTAIVPKQSYGIGLAKTLWKITPEVHYLFEDYRQASVQTLRPALYFQPFEMIKIGGGYQLQAVKFNGVQRKLNGAFGEIFMTPFEWLELHGYYWRTNNVFEAGRFPTPYLNFKSNIGGGGFNLKFIAATSIHFDTRFESRNNKETSQIYTLGAGYNF